VTQERWIEAERAARAVFAYWQPFEPQWRAFIEQLGEAAYPHDYDRKRGAVNELDRAAASYVGWMNTGQIVTMQGPVDEAQLREVAERLLKTDADRRVYIAICQHLAREFRVSKRYVCSAY
jgi:hypothetical protein